MPLTGVLSSPVPDTEIHRHEMALQLEKLSKLFRISGGCELEPAIKSALLEKVAEPSYILSARSRLVVQHRVPKNLSYGNASELVDGVRRIDEIIREQCVGRRLEVGSCRIGEQVVEGVHDPVLLERHDAADDGRPLEGGLGLVRVSRSRFPAGSIGVAIALVANVRETRALVNFMLLVE